MYAKGSSDVIAKLRGTWTGSASGAAPGVSTELQKSIFSGPPTSTAAGAVPAKPAGKKEAEAEGQGPQGVKRPRDEESDDGDAPMEEDESDVSMEASSDED